MYGIHINAYQNALNNTLIILIVALVALIFIQQIIFAMNVEMKIYLILLGV